MEHTKKALEVWDSYTPLFERLWGLADTNSLVEAVYRLELQAIEKVREAFYQDTKEFNSKSHASLIHPNDPWLRNLITKNTGV
ncbi:MAG TPA: hypothetical protein VM577_18895 [Anaerovoracaceae bacterium]|nr:hypothetical protein [Anaerovoracaceae bacterium]